VSDLHDFSLPSSVVVPRAVLEPVNVEFSVGDVSVGGLFSWVQRWALEAKTLRLTVLFAGDRAITTGSLKPLQLTRSTDLWVDSTTSADEIVSRTAQAILRGVIAEGLSKAASADPIEALEPEEFDGFLQSLTELADIRRRMISGGSREGVVERFVVVLERLVPLTDRFPDWTALLELTATVAEQAERVDVAEKLHRQADPRRAMATAEETRRLEQEFVPKVREFAERLFPGAPAPSVRFGMPPGQDHEGVNAIWVPETQTYHVRPGVDAPGSERFIALMGHFLAQNYDRCMNGDGVNVDVTLWNEYRHSLVEYLLQTDPDEPVRYYWGAPERKLFQSLLRLDSTDGVDRQDVRRLALGLLERYGCEWRSQAALADGILDMNAELGSPVAGDQLERALAGGVAPKRAL
jgi:hypothetical protein